jgi:hypothetical protein
VAKDARLATGSLEPALDTERQKSRPAPGVVQMLDSLQSTFCVAWSARPLPQVSAWFPRFARFEGFLIGVSSDESRPPAG